MLAAAAGMLLLAPAVQAERVKDLAQVSGVRGNQLVGYGLVVGLDGTGDQTSQAPFTIQSIKNMLARFGVVVPAARAFSSAARASSGEGAGGSATRIWPRW